MVAYGSQFVLPKKNIFCNTSRPYLALPWMRAVTLNSEKTNRGKKITFGRYSYVAGSERLLILPSVL